VAPASGSGALSVPSLCRSAAKLRSRAGVAADVQVRQPPGVRGSPGSRNRRGGFATRLCPGGLGGLVRDADRRVDVALLAALAAPDRLGRLLSDGELVRLLAARLRSVRKASPSSPSGSASPLRAASIWRRRGRPPRTLTRHPRAASASAARSGAPDAVEPGRPVDLAGRRRSFVVVRPQLEGVVVVGRLVRALPRPGFDRIRRGVEQLGQPGLLAPPELAQNVVDASRPGSLSQRGAG